MGDGAAAGLPPKASALPTPGAPPSPAARIIHPAEYKPNNPRWIADLAAADPATLPDPPLPPGLTSLAAAPAVEPGTPAAAALFALDPAWAYLNHGSYGAAPRAALEAQAFYREQLEAQPVLFMETTALAGVAKAVARVAALVGADWRDVVPVTNATTAVGAVVGSLQLQPGDLLLMANTTYPAVRSALARAAVRAGAALLEVSLPLDARLGDADAVVAAFEAALAVASDSSSSSHGSNGGGSGGKSGDGNGGGCRVRLAVIDHVISFPPVVMPVARLCKLFGDAGVPVLVDGAHAIGAIGNLHIPDDLGSVGCTYYTSNLHKWLCAPKGCAFLWARRDAQAALAPPVTSHGYGLGFRAEFFWQGTADPTAWLAVPACLAVFDRLGGLAAVSERNRRVAAEAAAMLRARWRIKEPPLGAGGEATTGGDGDNGGSSSGSSGGSSVAMSVVRLPRPLALATGEALAATPEGAAALQRHLRAEHRVEVPVVAYGGDFFCRVSAQVYNSAPQYERLAAAVEALWQQSTTS